MSARGSRGVARVFVVVGMAALIAMIAALAFTLITGGEVKAFTEVGNVEDTLYAVGFGLLFLLPVARNAAVVVAERDRSTRLLAGLTGGMLVVVYLIAATVFR